jgi:hypothetical protein
MRRVSRLRDAAEKCRRTAEGVPDPSARSGLLSLAREYDARAERIIKGLEL